ncbi:hypothetical protein PAPHI01_0396 [Pancytospora philotis]|nr:hypothetical protein PAPHI01_0396 [Pancytospora philotis]
MAQLIRYIRYRRLVESSLGLTGAIPNEPAGHESAKRCTVEYHESACLHCYKSATKLPTMLCENAESAAVGRLEADKQRLLHFFSTNTFAKATGLAGAQIGSGKPWDAVAILEQMLRDGRSLIVLVERHHVLDGNAYAMTYEEYAAQDHYRKRYDLVLVVWHYDIVCRYAAEIAAAVKATYQVLMPQYKCSVKYLAAPSLSIAIDACDQIAMLCASNGGDIAVFAGSRQNAEGLAIAIDAHLPAYAGPDTAHGSEEAARTHRAHLHLVTGARIRRMKLGGAANPQCNIIFLTEETQLGSARQIFDIKHIVDTGLGTAGQNITDSIAPSISRGCAYLRQLDSAVVYRVYTRSAYSMLSADACDGKDCSALFLALLYRTATHALLNERTKLHLLRLNLVRQVPCDGGFTFQITPCGRAVHALVMAIEPDRLRDASTMLEFLSVLVMGHSHDCLREMLENLNAVYTGCRLRSGSSLLRCVVDAAVSHSVPLVNPSRHYTWMEVLARTLYYRVCLCIDNRNYYMPSDYAHLRLKEGQLGPGCLVPIRISGGLITKSIPIDFSAFYNSCRMFFSFIDAPSAPRESFPLHPSLNCGAAKRPDMARCEAAGSGLESMFELASSSDS